MNKKDNKFVLRWAKKIKAIKLLGGKCLDCGCDNPLLIEFHHSQNNKEHIIARLLNSRWSVIEREVKKCTPLCSNCHVELHNNLNGRHNKEKKRWLKSLKLCSCEECGHTNNSLASLEFHHIDKNNKRFCISNVFNRNKNVSVQELKDELYKCRILCRNCHKIEHFNTTKFKKFYNEIIDRHIHHEEKTQPINKDEVSDLYFNKGMKQIEIAKRMGCAKSTVCGIIKGLKMDIK